jgi:hypothetical protein
MNPATFEPRSPSTPPAPVDEVDASPDGPQPYAHLEPEREGILFAVACVLCSAVLYAGVLFIL